MTIGLTRKSPILKYLLDLSVDAPQYLSPETLTLPMLSNSVLYFISYNTYNTLYFSIDKLELEKI